MDIHSKIVYAMGHATPWNLSTARSTKTASRSSAAGWQDVPVCGRDAERFDKLRGALGPGLSPRWGSSPAGQTNAGAPATVVQVAKAQAPATVGARCWRSGLYDRAMDSAANCQADRETFRDSLSLRSCMASDDGSKMDMAEAGASSHAEKRASHRTLEEAAVAGVKKKPQDLGAGRPYPDLQTQLHQGADFCHLRSHRLPIAQAAWTLLPFP